MAQTLATLPAGALAHVAPLVDRLHPLLAHLLCHQASVPPLAIAAPVMVPVPDAPRKPVAAEDVSLTSRGSSVASSFSSSVDVPVARAPAAFMVDEWLQRNAAQCVR